MKKSASVLGRVPNVWFYRVLRQYFTVFYFLVHAVIVWANGS